MQLQISPRIFEWLLAQMAGHGHNPGIVFSKLRNVSKEQLFNELADAMRNAGADQNLVDHWCSSLNLPSTSPLA